jgi:tRNA threonylcarbamoyl adenosine modification protein YeaZ
MLILAFDTAMAACSSALYDASLGRVIARRHERMERGHAEALAPMILDVMDEAGVGFDALARIGVTIGPGTFTGVRTSVAMARGFALALGVPVIGLDTLSAIAANVADDGRPLVVAADARRGEVYFSTRGSDTAPIVIPIAEAVRRLPQGPVSIIGTGSEAVIEAASCTDIHRLRDGDVPDAAKFAPLCTAREQAEGPVEPLYLRPADARPQTGPARANDAIAIRTASSSESPILAAMHAECFDNPWGAPEFARLMAMPGALSRIAMDGNEPVAFLLARQAADEAEILTIGTRPFARRRGIAKRLIADLARSLPDAKSLFIEVADGNRAAKGLYEREGFKVAGARRGYYEKRGQPSEDAIVMVKALTR